MRALEHDGAILGYRAIVDPNTLGVGFEALGILHHETGDSAPLKAFETAVVQIPNVLQAQRLFGDPDYLLSIRTADLDA